MSPHPRATAASYMRSNSTSSSASLGLPQQSPATPQFSNQHWLSSFRQGLDGIDELDHEHDEGMEGQVQTSSHDMFTLRDHSPSGHSLPVSIPPASSSPPASVFNSDLSAVVNMRTDSTSSATSLCSSLCFSDALRSPPDHEFDRNIDVVFLAKLQERLALVAHDRNIRETYSGQGPLSVNYYLDWATSAAQTYGSMLASTGHGRYDSFILDGCAFSARRSPIPETTLNSIVTLHTKNALAQ